MDWPELMSFIDARDPDYRTMVEGVPPDAIDTCQQGLGIVLPRLYVDFLLGMGSDTGTFRPFGATQSCSFYQLIEELSPEDYPTDRYFRISLETDTSEIEWYDHYLDLTRSDGEDAALVRFERGLLFPDLEQEGVQDVGFTFGEQLARRAFDSFELRRRPFGRALGLLIKPGEQIDARVRAVVDVLKRMGFGPVLSPLPRVACLRREGSSALFEVRTATMSMGVIIGGDEHNVVAVAVEQFLDALPGSYVSEPMWTP